MLTPLQQFICDTCGQVIETPDEGWFEWQEYYDEKLKKIVSKNYRICHHQTKCQRLNNAEHANSLPLREVAGNNAAIFLANQIDVGRIHAREYHGPYPEDMTAFAEFMRRLTLSYYEEARQYWAEARADGFFADGNEVWIYKPLTLQRIIEDYGPSE